VVSEKSLTARSANPRRNGQSFTAKPQKREGNDHEKQENDLYSISIFFASFAARLFVFLGGFASSAVTLFIFLCGFASLAVKL
jgi:hypothetical protein